MIWKKIINMDKPRTLFIVRHGTSEGNIDPSKYYKKHDSEITLVEQGEQDSINAAHTILNISTKYQEFFKKSNLINEPIRFACYHSSYKRAVDTANIITDYINSQEGFNIEYKKSNVLLRERHWGNLRNIYDMGQDIKKYFNFYYKPENGESFADVYHRVATFHTLFERDSPYENNIIVAHGELIRVYLMYILNWSVEEFEKYKNPRNGEVIIIKDGCLSSLTPLKIYEN
jgi:broad specificity phosphatase PhoE